MTRRRHRLQKHHVASDDISCIQWFERRSVRGWEPRIAYIHGGPRDGLGDRAYVGGLRDWNASGLSEIPEFSVHCSCLDFSLLSEQESCNSVLDLRLVTSRYGHSFLRVQPEKCLGLLCSTYTASFIAFFLLCPCMRGLYRQCMLHCASHFLPIFLLFVFLFLLDLS